jgi:hypothetical protein
MERIPISLPLARTSGVTCETGSPLDGSRAIVVPRASLLWKPRPAFTYSSVPRHGPTIAPPFGLTIPANVVPLFTALLAPT